jgi:antitoxin ParD1/3/4
MMLNIIEISDIREKKLKFLQSTIAVGKEQITKGQFTDGGQVFARLQEKINRVKES